MSIWGYYKNMESAERRFFLIAMEQRNHVLTCEQHFLSFFLFLVCFLDALVSNLGFFFFVTDMFTDMLEKIMCNLLCSQR